MLNHHTYVSTSYIITSTGYNSTGSPLSNNNEYLVTNPILFEDTCSEDQRTSFTSRYPHPICIWVDENEKLEYDWTEGDILLQEFMDSMYENAIDNHNS